MSELLAVSVTANLFLIFSYLRMRSHCKLISQLLEDIASGHVELVTKEHGGFEVHVTQPNNVR